MFGRSRHADDGPWLNGNPCSRQLDHGTPVDNDIDLIFTMGPLRVLDACTQLINPGAQAWLPIEFEITDTGDINLDVALLIAKDRYEFTFNEMMNCSHSLSLSASDGLHAYKAGSLARCGSSI